MATQHGAWALAFERRCGMLAPGRFADLAILRSLSRHADPSEAVLDPATQLTATLRRGRVIAGNIA
jgi:imidazolonepropionase-like amidohydrolase